MMESIELFFATYEKTALAFMSFTTFIGICSAVFYRAHIIIGKKKDIKAKADSATSERLKDIEKRLHHLDDPETGRVHMVSDLCKEQIKTNGKAMALASYVKGRLDAKSNP